MIEVHERVYELAAGALAEQERQASELRGRAAGLLGAGSVIAGLLAGPVVSAGQSRGLAGWIAVATGLGGCAALLICCLLVLAPSAIAFSLDPTPTYHRLRRARRAGQPLFDLALAEAVEARFRVNEPRIASLRRLLVGSIVGLLLETGGLALAAVLGS